MAATGVLKKLQERANLADVLIKELREQLGTLQSSYVVSACREEEEKLKIENDQLKREIEDLKAALSCAEGKNGVKQIPLPSKQSSIRKDEVKIQKNEPATQQQTKTVPKAEPQPSKKKEKKQEKKAADNKAKEGEGDAAVDVSRLDMRVGHIVAAKKHPDADTLYVEEVDLGEGHLRTVVSGLVKHIPLEKMQDRLAVFMCNLKPAKMRGVLSQGMIMCASSPDKVEILEPPEGVVKGDRVFVEGYTGEPDAQLNPKKKIWEQVQPDLQVNASGVATYKGVPWNVAGKGNCKAPTMKNTQIR